MNRRLGAAIVFFSLALVGTVPVLARDSTQGPGASRGKLCNELFMAVTHGDLPGVRALLKQGADPNSRNGLDFMPLYLASASGQLDVMDALVKAGAKVDAPSTYGTALTFAAEGGSVPAMKYLLAHGAGIEAGRADHISLLMLTSRTGATEMVNELLRRKADVQARDNDGGTALSFAARDGQVGAGRLLLAAGAAVDAADSRGWTPLMYAAVNGHGDFVRLLLGAKAKPGLREKGGRTALVLAAGYGDYPDVIKALKKSATPAELRTAAALATRRGYTACGAALGQPAGKPAALRTPREAILASLKPLQGAMLTFTQRTGCISCHHEGLGRMALGAARERGFTLDAALRTAHQKRVGGMVNGTTPLHLAALKDPAAMNQVPLIEIGEVNFTDVYLLSGMAAEKDPPSEGTGAMAMVLARQQLPNGMWHFGGPRIPMQSNSFSTTSLALHCLSAYGPPAEAAEIRERTTKAKAWLLSTAAQNSDERAYRLLGLGWAGATEAEREPVVAELRKDQRPDGGWSQVPGLASDAYATGEALYALHVGGGVAVSDPAYQRGVQFLLRTQDADGSWFVNKRAQPANNYFDSGFPHGQSQYSSFNGSCWATIALLQLIEKPQDHAAVGRP